MQFKNMILFLSLLLAINAMGQDNTESDKLTIQAVVGLNIGGSAPLPLPAEVRKIKSYNPRFNPQLGFNVQYRLSDRWGIGSGLTVDWKSMRVKDKVKYMYTTIKTEDSEGTLTGYFVGDNMTESKLIYLTLPVYGTFDINKKWQVRLGVYLAKSLESKFGGTVSDGYIRIDTPTGQKQEITEATFDFDDDIRSVDFGMLGGANFNINNRLSVFGNLTWGLVPFFKSGSNPIEFNLHNIFGTLGIAYRIK